MPRAVVRLRDAHQLDVYHERRQHGRAAEQHRPTDRGRAGGRQRVSHQPFETDLVGQRTGAQRPVPIRQPIAVPQDAAGAAVGVDDPPAPVQVNDAYPRVVEQGGHGRVPHLGADQRLPDTDELPDMGSSPSTIAIREDPQPSEATGSRRPQVMEQPSGPSSRAFMLSWPPVRNSISL